MATPPYQADRTGRAHDYLVADVFTATALQGNPVAIFLDAADLSADSMQHIARELNLSETTFVLPAEKDGDVRVRIFTPVNELPFAGHPTLGTAIALSELMSRDHLVLETAMGAVPFGIDRTAPQAATGRMRQPIPSWQPYEHAEQLLQALAVPSSTLPVEMYCLGPRHVYVGLPTVAELSRLKPDHRALSAFADMAAICFAGKDSHWRMRMFSPAYGVVEDAATGSAAGPLAVHLARHGLIGFGQQIEIRQGVEIGRPSVMYATASGSSDRLDRVEVAGQAVVVAHGTLHI